jgi:predicted ATP-binding protein involved in virulence
MRIDKLDLINFKNFAEIRAEFTPGINLLVGGNGSGKTSILEGINIALGGFFGSQEQKMQRMIEFDEIRIVEGSRLAITTVSAYSALLEGSWDRNIKRDTRTNDGKSVKLASTYGQRFLERFEDPLDRTIAPLISFYSTQRLFKDSSASSKQKYDPGNSRRNGYLQCLKESAIKFTLNDWLAKAVTKRATMQIKQIEEVDLVLENVEQAIRETLILFLNLTEDFSLKIYPDPEFDNELFVNYDKEHNLPISYYSDGFRNLIYLIFDMVWRASQLNPWLNLNGLAENVFGVVTIDEIDLHLHPKWQSKAIEIVQKLFPKVQFFITTHSPSVVANMEHGTLYVINDNQIIRHDDDYFGKQINYVLRDILGAADRHIPTQIKLDRLFLLIDREEKASYDALLLELTNLLGEDDPDLFKARTLIDWIETKLG